MDILNIFFIHQIWALPFKRLKATWSEELKSVINLKEPCHGMWCLSIRCHWIGFKYFNWALIIFYLHSPLTQATALYFLLRGTYRGHMAQHSGMQTCNLSLRRMSHVFMMEMVVVGWYLAAFQSFKYISLLACNEIFRSKNQYKCGFMKIKCVWGGRIKNTSNQLDMLMYVIDWKKITTKLYIMYSVDAGQYI